MIAWELLMQNSFWAGLAAVGFALLFNVPRRTLFGCTLAGALGYAVRSLLLELGLVGIETGTLLAATLVSVLGVMFGRGLARAGGGVRRPGVDSVRAGLSGFQGCERSADSDYWCGIC